MKKEQRKEFELQIISSIEQLLTTHDSKAAEKVKKHIRDAGKNVARKFYKAAKTNASDTAKIAAKAIKLASAKSAIAVAAVTTKSPGTKKAVVKPVKKKKK